MHQIDFLADTLPVVELTPRGEWITVGHAHGVTMSRYRRGAGFAWKGRWKTVELFETTPPVKVVRWQTDRIIVQRVEVAGHG